MEAIEKRLWKAADTLRANSNYASNEYFIPVMGLLFLRHAYNRYLNVKDGIIASLPSRGGKTRELTKEDFSKKSAIFLQEKAQFDHLTALPDSADRSKALIEAMESIENDYENLAGLLPKQEYLELDNEVLGQLLRIMNPEELKQASGDVFGRIYEYFLTQFADLKAHDNGEFFTPISLVSLIANIIEPYNGIVFDPACGSGGMFVQSAHFVEKLHQSPTDKLTFKGYEKNKTTIRLAKMNLAVHGLEGIIQQNISYYDDPLELLGKANFVMANPPFNVDEVDAEKVRRDPRLPFGLPGENKAGKVSNGNYIWISYFYSYLNETGRAGFVMSSQASNAGRDEAKVRQKLIETGDVDIMVSIRSNFFYTRTVPCELWFLNRAKLAQHKDKVLMIDARNTYRKVTRKIYDFSPEQEQNILAIVWLYRGYQDRFENLVFDYLQKTVSEAIACSKIDIDKNSPVFPFKDFPDSLAGLRKLIQPYENHLKENTDHAEILEQFDGGLKTFQDDADEFAASTKHFNLQNESWKDSVTSTYDLRVLSDKSRDLVKDADLLYKLIGRLIDICENELNVKDNESWNIRDINKIRKLCDENRKTLVEQLKQVSYFHKQALWLVERFPEAELRDVEGLVKLVDRTELETNDWSLTPGRYVGVAPEVEDENFDFEETMREIHVELEGLNTEAIELAGKIRRNFEELGI